VKKKRGIGRARRRPTHSHAHLNNNPGGRRGTTTTLQQEAIVGDADASADVSADAVATDVPVDVAKQQSSNFDSTSKAANTDELSALLTFPAPQESSSSPMKPSALFPTDSAFYKTRRSAAAASSKKFLQHTSLGEGVTLVMHFSEQEHKVFCSALSKFLEQEDVSSDCAVLSEFLEEQCIPDHPMAESSTESSAIPPSSESRLPLHVNRQLVDFNKVGSFDLNFRAFSYKLLKDGSKVDRGTDYAIRQAESRATRKLVAAIMDSGDDDAQRAIILHRTLCHESTRHISKSAGFQSEKMSALSYHMDQLRLILDIGSSSKGRTNKDQSLVTDTILTAVAAGSPSKHVPSMKDSMELLGMKYTGAGRSRMKRAITMRKEIKAAKLTSRNAKWVSLLQRKWKGHRKVTPAIRSKVLDWIRSHEHVINSPIYNETLLIKDPETSVKKRVAKLLLEIPVRELHNNLVAPVAEGGLAESRDATGAIIISDTNLRVLIKESLPQLRRMSSRHKQMCGCETCIIMSSLQKSLNGFRRRQEKSLSTMAADRRYICQVLPSGEHWHDKPMDALKEIQCPPLLCGFPHWNCVLRKCKECPSYKIPRNYEDGLDENAPTIRFHYYCKATKCSKHGDLVLGTTSCDLCSNMGETSTKGKVRTRKYLTLLTKPVGIFHRDYYQSMLEKYAIHLWHVRILSKCGCGAMRLDWFKRSLNFIKTIRDYAERLKFEFNLEIQSEHFGNCRSLSIEGCSCRYMRLAECLMEMHSHFSDSSRQDSRTTFAHMQVELKYLEDAGIIQKGSTNLEDTDGCAKQYRSGTSLYLNTLLATTHGIVIDRAVGAPGHGKDEVDGLNAVDKRFINEKMALIITPEENESSNRMHAAARVDDASMSIAAEAARMCRHENRAEGVKSEGKYRKREESSSMKKRIYHVDEPCERHQFENLAMVCKPWYKPKESQGHSLKFMYNFRADPKLGLGLTAIRRIPCACAACRSQLIQAWVPNVPPEEQPRYQTSPDCVFSEIFEPSLNDWHLVELVPGKDNDTDDVEEVHKLVVKSWAEVAEVEIKEGQCGAFSTEDPDADGYYLVKWLGAPYPLEESCLLTEYEPPIFVPEGELVCDAAYFNKVPRAPQWYTLSSNTTKVRLCQVLVADVNLVEESTANAITLPNTCNRREARTQGARKLLSHDSLLDEIARRAVIEFVEDENGDVMDCSDDDVPVSSDEESDSDTSEV
jgi:hypothetical protein